MRWVASETLFEAVFPPMLSSGQYLSCGAALSFNLYCDPFIFHAGRRLNAKCVSLRGFKPTLVSRAFYHFTSISAFQLASST
jgi:hypothetical protein